MKRFLSAIAITLVFALLAACGGSPASPAPKSEDPSPAPDSPAAPAITKLVIGLDDQFPPMGFRDRKSVV